MSEDQLNLKDPGVRSKVLTDLKSEDNRNRKRDQQKRYDVYNDLQDRYILERLRREFGEKTVQEMRKIFSINLAKRIVDSKSSVYQREPERIWSTRSGNELSEDQVELLNQAYEHVNVNVAMKKANVYYNLHDQCALMCVPDKKGGFKVRAVPPMHYDVIPDATDPEKAYAYILNVWDKDLHQTAKSGSEEFTQLRRYKGNDRNNQTIADDDDRKAMLERYIVWTNDLHFTMDGKGNIIGEMIDNPIGRLPFIDVAPMDKDFQFFLRRGSGTVDFSLDYGMMLSDNANVIRLQSYSQAVIASEKIPANLTVGPNHILHLKLDPKRPELSPRFEFVTPNPDLDGTQQFLNSLLNLHLTSLGLDTSVVNTVGETEKFASGVDRLLAMVSKFEASRDDFDLFRHIEDELLSILYRWSNVFQNVVGEGELKEELRGPQIPEDVQVDVQYSEPEAVQTKSELEESLNNARENGYKSRIDVLMKLNNVNRDKAIEMAQQIDEDERLYGEMSGVPNIGTETVIEPQAPDFEEDDLEDVST